MKKSKIDDILMNAGFEFDNAFKELKVEGKVSEATYNLFKGYMKINAGLYYMTGRFDATQPIKDDDNYPCEIK